MIYGQNSDTSLNSCRDISKYSTIWIYQIDIDMQTLNEFSSWQRRNVWFISWGGLCLSFYSSFDETELTAEDCVGRDQQLFHCLFQDSAEFDLLFENAFDQWVASTASEKCTFFQILHHTCQRYLTDRKPEFINCQSKIMGGKWALTLFQLSYFPILIFI